MKRIYGKLCYKISARRRSWLHARKQKRVRRMILRHYNHHPPRDQEIAEAVTYLSTHPLTTFYGTFQERYDASDVEVLTDPQNGLPYVITEGGKLYFKRSLNNYTIQLLFNNLRVEQDRHAPHCYTDRHFFVEKGERLADVGCAEGYFSLMNIEQCEALFLFEQESEWIEALEATFAPWREKVSIIPQFVSDINSEQEITLDHYFREHEEKPSFYKIDVEGAEASVLRGMEGLLLEREVKIALCTYHHQHDYERFRLFFEERGYSHRPNAGVMIYQNDMEQMRPPYFRKCLIKAVNHHASP